MQMCYLGQTKVSTCRGVYTINVSLEITRFSLVMVYSNGHSTNREVPLHIKELTLLYNQLTVKRG